MFTLKSINFNISDLSFQMVTNGLKMFHAFHFFINKILLSQQKSYNF